MAIYYIEKRGRLPRRTLGPPRNDISFFLSSSCGRGGGTRLGRVTEESAILKTQNFELKKGTFQKVPSKIFYFF